MTANMPALNQASVCRPYSTNMIVRSPEARPSSSARSVSAIAFSFPVDGLAQGLFLDPAGAFAPFQFGDHVRGAQAVVCQRNHAVEPQVGHFADDALAVAAMVRILGRHHDLGGFLADLLEEGIRAL